MPLVGEGLYRKIKYIDKVPIRRFASPRAHTPSLAVIGRKVISITSKNCTKIPEKDLQMSGQSKRGKYTS